MPIRIRTKDGNASEQAARVQHTSDKSKKRQAIKAAAKKARGKQ